METLIHQGGAVKSLGDGKVGGYLIVFGTAEQPDQSIFRDFFTPDTDFAVELPGAKSAAYYHHGLDLKLGKRRLGSGTLKADAVGVWIEAQLALRDEWEQGILGLAEAGKLSWSSGTASHLVEREAIKNAEGEVVAHQITHWPLGLDASLTPTPAEFRAQAVALKTLTPSNLGEETPERPSLAERTEQWLERGSDLLTGYRTIQTREAVKIGRALSAARRRRLEDMRDLLTEMLAETQPREEADQSPAGMGEAEVKTPEAISVSHSLRTIRGRLGLLLAAQPHS